MTYMKAGLFLPLQGSGALQYTLISTLQVEGIFILSIFHLICNINIKKIINQHAVITVLGPSLAMISVGGHLDFSGILLGVHMQLFVGFDSRYPLHSVWFPRVGDLATDSGAGH